MAAAYSKAPCIIIQKPFSVSRAASLVSVKMLGRSQLLGRRTASLRIESSINKRVFEDQTEGIVCYVDDAGEIICEGFDEGPRFHPRVARLEHRTGEAKIPELVHRNWYWIQIINSKDLKSAAADPTVREEFNWNWL